MAAEKAKGGKRKARPVRRARAPEFACDRCGDRLAASVERWRCDCGGPLSPVLPKFRKAAIDRGKRSVWRYGAMLPADAVAAPVTLGEGGTPLVPASIVGMPVHAKLEFTQPTGSHKDRGAAVLAAALKAAEVRHAVEDSSGNAGASLAAYLARANIGLQLFVPASAPPAKMRQAAAYGASIDDAARSRTQAGRMAQEAAGCTAVYASHVYSPYFFAGQMTLAWEIWEDLGFRAPDDVVIPVGHGLLLLAIYRGFQELDRAGFVEHMPRFFGVQARACAPIYEAFARGSESPATVAPSRTTADGVRISNPPRGREVLRAIADTGGAMLNVSEAEIRRGQALAANVGWYIEPASAVAVAGLVKLDKVIDPTETVVLPLTGSGLKSV